MSVIGDGERIRITFDKPLYGDPTGVTPVPRGGYKYKKVNPVSVSALNAYSGQGASLAIDGSTSTYWRGTTQVNWIQFGRGSSIKLGKIRLYMGSYYVKTLKISASNDGTNWTDITDTLTVASSTTAQWYDIVIDSEVEYSYFRINTITGYSTSRIYIYEVELYARLPVGSETSFSANFQTRKYAPDGEFEDVSRIPDHVEVVPGSDNKKIDLVFDPGNKNSIQNAYGNIVLSYDGSGGLIGEANPVAPFDWEFTPVGLVQKPDQMLSEHIGIGNITAAGNYILIRYSNAQENEHIELSSISASGVMTNVGDI